MSAKWILIYDDYGEDGKLYNPIKREINLQSDSEDEAENKASKIWRNMISDGNMSEDSEQHVRYRNPLVKRGVRGPQDDDEWI